MNTVALTQSRLHELFDYDPATGNFTRKISPANRVKVGDIAGGVDNRGYLVFRVNGKTYSAHRLVWLYVTGEFPHGHIDHINGVRTDNRLCNLRDVPVCGNAQNQRVAQKNNKLGVLGVYKTKHGFRAHIRVSGKLHHLGYFSTADDAHKAYLKAKKEMHPFSTLEVK